jgi:hypothetical protein
VEHLLPPRLGALLALEPDVTLSERLRRVHEAGARAISKLGELDLIRYEDSPIDGSADLSLWEELAPVVGSTLAVVNDLLAETENQFLSGVRSVSARDTQVDAIVAKANQEVRAALMQFGMRVRDPSVVGDRWNLIAEVQAFRFRMRERIGSMVFETAQVISECRRKDVDPGYDEALASTLVVRSTTADLRRLVRSRIHKVSEAESEDVEWNAQQMEKELNAFGRTAAWRALRAQDKKEILEFRAKLKEYTRADLTKAELLGVLEPFVEFVDGFNEVNRRELLIQHDQEVLAAVGVTLERAMNAMNHDEQLAAFTEAVGQGQALYGRSQEFDAFLRKLRKAALGHEGLKEEVEHFVLLLANLSLA